MIDKEKEDVFFKMKKKVRIEDLNNYIKKEMNDLEEHCKKTNSIAYLLTSEASFLLDIEIIYPENK